MGHSQKKAENLLASSVAEVQMRRRSGRRLQASVLVSHNLHQELTLHKTKQDISGDCPFVRFIQHDDRVFRAVGIDQQFSQEDTVRLMISSHGMRSHSP